VTAARNAITGLAEKPWLWAFVAAIAVWLAIVGFTRGYGGGQVLTAASPLQPFQ
jgi:ribose transport system permease protein